MQTTRDDVYAVGDVTGIDMFVYMAAYGGKLAALNALEGNHKQYDDAIMPTVVFTDPQVADVGLTERQAKEQNINIKTSSIILNHVPRFIAAHDTRGLIKLIANKNTDKLLGVHILAPEAGEMIQTAVTALKAGMTTEDLANSIFPYLTGVEGLKLAALNFDKDVKKTIMLCWLVYLTNCEQLLSVERPHHHLSKTNLKIPKLHKHSKIKGLIDAYLRHRRSYVTEKRRAKREILG